MKLFLIVLIWIIFPPLTLNITAQKEEKDQNRKKHFGWSLKKFEKKGKDSSRDKENNRQHLEKNGDSNDEVIRVATDMIVSDVLVVNEKGDVIPGLKQNDFIITENGVGQKCELFSFGENAALPRSIVLIIRSVPPIKYSWMKNNIEGANALIEKLAPQDKMAIAITEQKLITDFTQDKARLKKTIKDLTSNVNADGRIWREWGTLMSVLGEMFSEKDVRPIVIFQASAKEHFFLKGELSTLPPNVQKSYKKNDYYEYFGGERGYSFNDVLESVEKSRATIYSVIPHMRFVGLPGAEQLRRARLVIVEQWRLAPFARDLKRAENLIQEDDVNQIVRAEEAVRQAAKLSGGYTEYIEKPEDAGAVFETIFGVINNRYTIGYYTTDQIRNGKRREIKIAVKGHPEYSILARTGYIF